MKKLFLNGILCLQKRWQHQLNQLTDTRWKDALRQGNVLRIGDMRCVSHDSVSIIEDPGKKHIQPLNAYDFYPYEQIKCALRKMPTAVITVIIIDENTAS